MGLGESGFNCWGVKGYALLLFLFHVNVSGMRPRFHLSYQLLTIPLPGFSSASGNLSPCLNGSILGDFLPFHCGEYGS